MLTADYNTLAPAGRGIRSATRNQSTGHLARGRAQIRNLIPNSIEQLTNSDSDPKLYGREHCETSTDPIYPGPVFAGVLIMVFRVQFCGTLGELHHPIPSLYVLFQKAQKHENPLNPRTAFKYRDGEVKRQSCEVARLRAAWIYEQVFNCLAVLQPLRDELGQIMNIVCESKTIAEPLLSQIKNEGNQNCEKSDRCGRPCSDCSHGVPPDDAVIYTQPIAAKNPTPCAHSFDPLSTGRHSATAQSVRAVTVTLATVKPPRDLRTRLREDV